MAEGVPISAIGNVVSVAFGTGDRLPIVIVSALTTFYTSEGGMREVIWTDVLQFALYLAGSIAAFSILLDKIPAAAGGELRVFDFTCGLTRSCTFLSGLLGGTL